MKKTMKLTYLLTLLLLLFTFTACGDKEDKTTEKDNTKVEDSKDKDAKDDTEDTSSEEDASSEDGDSEDGDTTASSGNATLGDITFTVNEEWTLDSSSVEGSSLTYLIPSTSGDFNNNFIAQVTDVGAELTDEDLQKSADDFIKAYEDSFGATLVEQSTFDTACGTAMVFTLDVTKMVDPEGTTGLSAYIKQAIFVNGTKTYIAQLTCVSDDLASLEGDFDNILSSVAVK